MNSFRQSVGVLIFCSLFLLFGCRHGGKAETPVEQPQKTIVLDKEPQIAPINRIAVSGVAAKIVQGAKIQVKEAAIYTPGYFSLKYPGGDLPRNQGVCTDVVVRSLRHAGYDLQQLIHEDMTKNFSKYPTKWGLKKPDKNIDHRRVPNHMCFLGRFGSKLPLDKDWKPGDLIYWSLGGGLEHCGVISDGLTKDGRPLIVHNIDICREEDCFNAWKIIGHYRYPRVP